MILIMNKFIDVNVLLIWGLYVIPYAIFLVYLVLKKKL